MKSKRSLGDQVWIHIAFALWYLCDLVPIWTIPFELIEQTPKIPYWWTHVLLFTRHFHTYPIPEDAHMPPQPKGQAKQ